MAIHKVRTLLLPVAIALTDCVAVANIKVTVNIEQARSRIERIVDDPNVIEICDGKGRCDTIEFTETSTVAEQRELMQEFMLYLPKPEDDEIGSGSSLRARFYYGAEPQDLLWRGNRSEKPNSSWKI